MKSKYIVGTIVIIACFAVGIYSLKTSMTPYVPFDEAMKITGRDVQIIGDLVKESSSFDKQSGEFVFSVKEKETNVEMKIKTSDSLPPNFEHSTQVVAIGSYSDGYFNASRILVKCPSKYEKKAAEEADKG
ncbi:MAG TPA: cytochrome c maturation protein CcmE [bacterium]|nr:cytochrome c maturation protein CcmE [bacterium]